MSERIAKRFVLDAHAAFAWLSTEPIGARVQAILSDAEAWMTLVNLGEVTYIIERRHGETAADTVFANLLATTSILGKMPIRWLPVDQALVRRAASLKARGGLSYADCFAAAAAAELGCPVLTGNPEFRRAEQVGIEVEWL